MPDDRSTLPARVETLRRMGLVEVEDNVRRAHALLAECLPWLERALGPGAERHSQVLHVWALTHLAGDQVAGLLTALKEVGCDRP